MARVLWFPLTVGMPCWRVREAILQKVSEYEQHAEECRKMALTMKEPMHKKQLEEMAEAWAMLAKERTKQIEKGAEAAVISAP